MRMSKVIKSEKSHEKGTKAHRMERKRSEVAAIKRAKAEPGKVRLSQVKHGISSIRKHSKEDLHHAYKHMKAHGG